MNLTDIPTSDLIYLSTLLAAGIAIIWLAVWGRGLTVRLREKRDIADRAVHARDKFEVNAIVKMEDQRAALAEKDRQIESILNDSNGQAFALHTYQEEAAKIKSQMIREIVVLKGLLKAHSNYARLIIHDPAKLEKWLERLRGKKGARKAKKTIETRLGTLDISNSKSTHAKNHK